MPINSNPPYVIDRLDTVMFGRGGYLKASKDIRRLLLSTGGKQTSNLRPADLHDKKKLYGNNKNIPARLFTNDDLE